MTNDEDDNMNETTALIRVDMIIFGTVCVHFYLS